MNISDYTLEDARRVLDYYTLEELLEFQDLSEEYIIRELLNLGLITLPEEIDLDYD